MLKQKTQALLLLLIVTSMLGAQNKSESLLLMFEKMQNNGFSISEVKRPVPKESVEIGTLTNSLNNFNANGSYKRTLPTISEADKNNSASRYLFHRNYLKDLRNVAQLYGLNDYLPNTIPNEHHHKTQYKNLVYNSLKWYFNNAIPPKSVYHQTFNYHSYDKTIVGLMDYIGMMLYADFMKDIKTNSSIKKLHEDIVDYCHHVVVDNPQSRGPNWAFRYGNAMRHVFFSNKTKEMDDFIATNNASLGFDVWAANGTDGIWPDWSLTHHGDEMYWGMYGADWLQNTLELAKVVKGTPWEYSTRNIQFIEESIIKGLRWVLYKGNCEYTTAPKRLTYWLDRTDSIPSTIISLLKKLIELHGDKLKDISQIQHLIDNIDPSWKDKKSDAEKKEFVGHKYFWNTEYQVHRRPNYSVAVRRTSQRVRGPEGSSNTKVKLHLHFGSGYTSILRRGDEYRLSRLGLDYQTLPGTTTELNGVVWAQKGGSRRRGGNLFSGAASYDRFGVGAFEMNIAEYNGRWNPINGAGALKGNFFFDKEIVCLGQEVKRIKSGSKEIWTTINQLQRRDKIVYGIDDKNDVTIELNQSATPTIRVDKKAWFWHDKIGYIIHTNKAVSIKLKAERRSLNPLLMEDPHYAAAVSNADKSAGINMFQLAINHGSNPNNDVYNYTVVPDIDLNDFKAYTNKIPFNVVANNNKMQAVYHPIDKILEAVFYQPGTITFDSGKTLTVNKKALVILHQKQNELSVSVAHPEQRGLTPSFVSSSSKTIGQLYNSPVNVTIKGFNINGQSGNSTTIPVSLPTARGYEGQTVTELVQLNKNGGFELTDEPLLESIKANGVIIENFHPTTFSYNVGLTYGSDIPSTEAFANEDYTVNILNNNTKNVSITVKNSKNETSTYTVTYYHKEEVKKVVIPNLSMYVETFTNLEEGVGWFSEEYLGDNNIEWSVNSVKTSKDLRTGQGVYIRSGDVTSQLLPGGIKSFSVNLLNKWNDSGNVVKVGLFINGQQIAVNENSSHQKAYTFSVSNLNIKGDIVIQLKNLSTETTTSVIDNISWEPSERLLSINENNFDDHVFIHPNPASNYIYITPKSSVSIKSATLIDTSGRNVYESSKSVSKINISSIKPGIYILRLLSDKNERFYKKVLIK